MNSAIARLDMSLGNTFEGALWARRALHPCDETTGGGVALPDLSQTESANLESRHFNPIVKEAIGDGPWDCQFVVLPTVDAVVAYRQKASSTTVWSYWHLVDLVNGVIKPGAQQVVASDWGPPAGTIVPTLLDSSTAFRQTFKGVTITQNSNALTNQGYVTAGQWGSVAEEISLILKFVFAASDRSETKCMVLKDVPDTPSDIVRNSPKAGAWESKYGVYMPMRFNQPVHDYNRSTGNVRAATDPDNNDQVIYKYGYPIVLEGRGDNITNDEFFMQNGLVWNGKPTKNDAGEIVSGSFYTTAGSINQNLGVVMFSGLHPTTNLEIKTRTGIELVPESTNVMAAFMSDAPLRDSAALDMVQAAQTKLQPVYEAKYNSTGAIVMAIASAVAALAPIVMPFFRKKQAPVPAPSTLPKYIEEDVD